MTTTARERIIKTTAITAGAAPAIAGALWVCRAHHRAPPSAERNRQRVITTRQRYIAERGGIEEVLANNTFTPAHELPMEEGQS